MRNKGFFYRTDDETTTSSNATSDCPNWLGNFAEQEALKSAVVKTASKTAVEVARERGAAPKHSLFEMMSAIIGNTTSSKFSSVEEVVKDYQSRTGLGDHISRKQASDKNSNISEIANTIISEAAKKETATTVSMADLKAKAQKLCAKVHGAKAADVKISFEKKEDKFIAISQCKGKVKSKPCENKREALTNLVEKLKTKKKDKEANDVANAIALDIKKDELRNKSDRDLDRIFGTEPLVEEAPEMAEETTVEPEDLRELMSGIDSEEAPVAPSEDELTTEAGADAYLSSLGSEFASFLGKKKV
jgi:hypothetical protein